MHRDIKSANILLHPDGIIKISDFGCSGLINCNIDPERNNLLNSLKGTLPWMAPEVICQQDYGTKADIWSLGCLLLEMYTGISPWGKLESYPQVLIKIGRSNEIPEIPTDISKNFKDFLLCCLVRDQEKRANIDFLLNHPFINKVNN